MSGWYYTQRGQPRVGPIELDELQFKAAFGDVAAEDLVWHEGLPDWVAAATVPELSRSFRARGVDPANVDVQPAVTPAARAATTQAPGTLAFAPAARPMVAAPAGHTAPEAGTDRRYLRIGSTFKVGEMAFYGDVVAGREALYLVLRQRRHDVARAVGGAVGGAVGRAIAAAIASRTGRGAIAGQSVAAFSALPAAVVNHPTWPDKSIKPETQVIVIPRSGISAAGIVHPKWGNLLHLNVGGERVIVEYLLFRGKRVRAFLEESGWPLSWGGEIAPIKRELEEAEAVRRSPRDRRLTWIFIGIVATLAVGLGVALLYLSSRPPRPTITLDHAVETEDTDAIAAHEYWGTDVNDGNGREPPLVRAASRGKALSVVALLDAKAAIEARDVMTGRTAAHEAALRGHPEILRTLKERGADGPDQGR